MPWVCERCGHLLPGNDPPCPQCGHGTVEQVRREHVPDRREPDALFRWRCSDCGHVHDRRRTRCADCDRVGLAPAYGVDATGGDGTAWSGDAGDSRGLVARHADDVADSTAWLLGLGIGLLTVVAGFLFLVGGSPRFGAPILAAGLFALPSVRTRLAALLGARPPGWFAACVYVICLVLGLVWYNL